MLDKEDISLIRKFQTSNDKLAFEALYKKYYPVLHDFAKWYGGDEIYRKDLIQNTFLVLYEKPRKFNPKYSLKTWLFTILRNLMINEKRRGESAQDRHLRYSKELHTDSQKSNPQVNNLKEIDRALYQLSEVQRTAFILKYHNNLTIKEISEVTSSSQGTVKSRLHNALVNIRELIIVSK